MQIAKVAVMFVVVPILLDGITMKETYPEKSGLDPRKFLYSITKMLQIIGLLGSPSGKWSSSYLVYSSVVIFLIFVQTFTQIMGFVLYSRDITTIAQNGVFTLLSLNSSFKAVWLWRKQAIIFDILADVTEHFRLTPPPRSDSKDLNVLNKRARGAYTSFLTLTTIAYFYWISSPFLQYATVLYYRSNNATGEHIAIYDMGYASLLAPAWYPVQVFYFPAYYIAYGFQFVSLTYIVCISVTVDLFCTVMLMRINAQLHFLVSDIEMASGSALAKIGGSVGTEVGDLGTAVDDYVMELIGVAKTCVSYHVDIIRVIRRFDEVLGGLAYMTTRLYTLVLVVGAMKIVELHLDDTKHIYLYWYLTTYLELHVRLAAAVRFQFFTRRLRMCVLILIYMVLLSLVCKFVMLQAHGIDANSLQLMFYCACFLYQLYLFYSPADDIIYAEIQHVASTFNALWQMKYSERL